MRTVIIKTASTKRLNNEQKMSTLFQRCSHIRPLLDRVEEPPALVLKFLNDNLLKASNTRKLERPEVKFVARGVLEALQIFHEAGYVHTGQIRRIASLRKGPALTNTLQTSSLTTSLSTMATGRTGSARWS